MRPRSAISSGLQSQVAKRHFLCRLCPLPVVAGLRLLHRELRVSYGHVTPLQHKHSMRQTGLSAFPRLGCGMAGAWERQGLGPSPDCGVAAG